MNQTSDLEEVFLEALDKFPDLADYLKNDFDYSFENELVAVIGKILEARKFDDQTLISCARGGYMKSPRALVFENCEDYVLQAVLSSKSTSGSVLDTIINQNPDWLESGWWCLQRLAANPNTSSQPLLESVKRVDRDNLDETILELIYKHPNLTVQVSDLLES